MFTTGVIPSGCDAGHPDGQEPPVSTQHDEDEASDSCCTETAKGRRLDVLRVGHPRTDQTQRPHPARTIGTTDAIGVVVGEIDADHQEKSHEQGKKCPQQNQSVHGRGHGGSCHHWCYRRRQRSGPGTLDPLCLRRHDVSSPIPVRECDTRGPMVPRNSMSSGRQSSSLGGKSPSALAHRRAPDIPPSLNPMPGTELMSRSAFDRPALENSPVRGVSRTAPGNDVMLHRKW